VSEELSATHRKRKTNTKSRLKKFKPSKVLFEERRLVEETNQQNMQ
jgi:hypothetical protein